MRRRMFSSIALIAAAAPRIVRAAEYPSRPIHIVVGSAAGSSPDALARLIAAGMSAQLSCPIVIDNKPGASTSIGTDSVVKALPDGYTLGYVTPSFVLNPALHATLPFDAERDLQPIVQFGSQSLVLAVGAASRYSDVDQLLDAARRQPGALTCASTGIGSIFHLAAERLATLAGTSFLHVPYSSGPQALNDLSTGRVDCMFNAVNALLPQLRSGRLRGLVTTGRTRCPVLQDLPTVFEHFKDGFEVRSWGGLVVQARASRDIVATLNAAANAALAEPALQRTLLESGYEIAGGTPEAFKTFLRDESVEWGRVIDRSGITMR